MPDWKAERHALGIEAMDTTHREFVTLLDALARADDAGFAAPGEHEGEHFRLLGDLLQFQRAIQRGRPALALGLARTERSA